MSPCQLNRLPLRMPAYPAMAMLPLHPFPVRPDSRILSQCQHLPNQASDRYSPDEIRRSMAFRRGGRVSRAFLALSTRPRVPQSGTARALRSDGPSRSSRIATVPGSGQGPSQHGRLTGVQVPGQHGRRRVALIAGLGIGSKLLEKKAAVEAAAFRRPRLKWIRCGPSRCRITGCSADHRRVGGRAGQRLDHPSRRFARSQGDRTPTANPPARGLLRAGAAGSRIRSGGKSDQPLGRPGQGLRLAGFESRHHRRLQRQRLDRRQRPRRPQAAGHRRSHEPDGGVPGRLPTTWS